VPYVTECLADAPGALVAASDYMKVLPNLIAKWTPRSIACLGTDGFGRSESRATLRDFFEVDARHIAFAALTELFREKQIEPAAVKKAIKELEIDPGKPNPMTS
jgi:pyruvate dehydrogenase E1 component